MRYMETLGFRFQGAIDELLYQDDMGLYGFAGPRPETSKTYALDEFPPQSS